MFGAEPGSADRRRPSAFHRGLRKRSLIRQVRHDAMDESDNQTRKDDQRDSFKDADTIE